MKRKIPGQLGPHLGVLVRGVIVEDDVDHLPAGMARSTALRKRKELLVPVASGRRGDSYGRGRLLG